MAANLNPPSHFSQPVVDRERKGTQVIQSLKYNWKTSIAKKLLVGEWESARLRYQRFGVRDPSTPDFQATWEEKTRQAEGARLLPPSSFKKRTVAVPDPWQALVQAKEKIDELQQENKQLRRNTKPKEEIVTKDHHSHIQPCSPVARDTPPPPPPPSSLPAHQYFHLQHTADILSKQATELAQVRSEVMTLRSQRQREVGELEEKLREVEVKYVTETTSLRATRKCQEEEHSSQMTVMKMKHEAEVASKQEKIESLSDELKTTQTRYEQEVSQLREQLLINEKGREKVMNELKNSSREKDLTIGTLQSQVNKLRAYIGDTQAASRSSSQWQIDREKQLKKIKELERELDNQRSAVQLLNVRLSSTNEILGIQETELSRVKGESADNGKKLQLLLTRWREKVFELLVQLKSQEIVKETIRRNHKWEITELEEKRTSLEKKCHLLEHSIADRDAQLQLQRGQTQSLQDELTSVQEVAELLDSRLSGYEEAVPQLKSLLQSFHMKHNGTVEDLGGLTSRLRSFDQRICFAVGRIDILKGLVARKDALWHLREEEMQTSSQVPPKVDAENVQNDNDRLSYEQLEMELQQVTHERDALATRMKRDSETMQEQYNAVRQKFESKQEQDASRLQELEAQLLQRSKDLNTVSTKLDHAESDCQESQRIVGGLKTQLAKLQLSTERASADKMAAMETQLTNQLAEMEQRLNDARREQAKAVVSLRQLERQMMRERERSAEILKTQEEHLQLEIDRVTSQLREADKERNLLMATLKQEGLVGQYKAQRATARRLDIEAEETTQKPTNGGAARPEVKGRAGHLVKQKAPLSAILTDLQSLTAQVLEDEDDIDDVGNTDRG